MGNPQTKEDLVSDDELLGSDTDAEESPDDKEAPQTATKKEKLLVDNQLENLIKRLHQLFTTSFDSKSFDLYIEPQVKDRETGVEFAAFERLGKFIIQENAASMLLAGEPGMGKTLLSLQIAQQAWYLFIQENIGRLLKDNYWTDVLTAYKRQNFAPTVISPSMKQTISLPLWLWMPFLRTEKNWEQQLLETHLKQSGLFLADIALLRQACQQRSLCLLPIMDGWDELPPIRENLYLLNGFWEEPRWPWIKVLSTCRPEAFVHYEKIGGFKSVFHPKPGAGEYTILNLSAFKSNHIEDYIKRYIATLPLQQRSHAQQSKERQPAAATPVPSSPSPTPTPQINAWDQAKTAWIADYEARYFKLSKTTPAQDEEKKDDGSVVDEQPTDWLNPKTYQYYLEHIPGLAPLIQTPFILSAVVQVLPNIVADYASHTGESQRAITRYTIYRHFVDYWLTTQARRLWEDPKKQLDLVDFRVENNDEASVQNLKACLFTYSENLGRLALNLGRGKVEVNLSDKDTLNPNLVIPAPGQSPHFAKEPVEEKKLQLIRSGCLLETLEENSNGSGKRTFKFLHKSLVEFFAAKTLFSGAHVAADSYLQRFDMEQSLHRDLSLNEQLLTSEPNIIHLLADQARDDIDFKYLLYQIIELSKGQSSVEVAAANAITILNAAGEPFSSRDFRGIHIRGAILNGALCDQTNFEGADLREVTAHNAWLQKANLKHAQVSGLDFKELPRIKHRAEISSLCLSSNGEWLLLGDKKGYVTQYSYPEGKQLKKWHLKRTTFLSKLVSFLGINPITAIVLCPNNTMAAACNIGTIGPQLIDIQKGEISRSFIPPIISEKNKFLQLNGSECKCITFCHTEGQYLAFCTQVDLLNFPEEEYKEWPLQLWNIKQHRLLGEYNDKDHCVEQLSTSNQGYTLIVRTKNEILLFSILNYTEGSLNPIQTLCQSNYFSLSQDEKFLVSLQGNSIELYECRNFLWELLPTHIQLKQEQTCESFTISPENALLIGRSLTQLHVWELSSGFHLYVLPVPEMTKIRDDSLFPVPRFFPSTKLHVFVSVRDTVYIWLLSQSSTHVSYPLHLEKLPVLLLAKVETTEKINTSLSSIKVVFGGIQINNTLTKEVNYLDYKKCSLKTHLSLSPNQNYLVSADKIDKRAIYGLLESKLASSFFTFINEDDSDTTIHIWDLKKYRLHFDIKHACKNLHHLFSADSEWLVSASKEIFIHHLQDAKKLAQFATGALVSDLVLSADKRWLFVADYNSCLSVFNTKTQQCLFSLKNIPIVVRELRITEDSQFLIASGKSEGVLTFRIIQEKEQKNEQINLLLINNTIELNLVCGEMNIEATRGLSQENQLLLEQNNAHGTPAARVARPVVIPSEESKELDPPHLVESSSRFRFSAERGEKASVTAQSATAVPPETKESEHEEQIDIGREFSFDRAVVTRDNADSFFNQRAQLSYGLWQVALVRDAESNSNSEHTFILVEGMDAFGRCFFWKFDLVTTIINKGKAEQVQKGFAKVNIQPINDIKLAERETILQGLLNPRNIRDRGVNSLAGHVWQIKREKVLDLYHAVQADKAKGLLPYKWRGDQSWFGGKGDNCYSWACRHLLGLREPKIQSDLKYKGVDQFVVWPALKLTKSLNLNAYT